MMNSMLVKKREKNVHLNSNTKNASIKITTTKIQTKQKYPPFYYLKVFTKKCFIFV